MEIDITNFVTNTDPFEFSASRAERGENAGPETWHNAQTQAEIKPLLHTAKQLAAMRHWMRESGGWGAAERAAFSDNDLNALFIQLISGDIREAEDLCGSGMCGSEFDWGMYEHLSERGTISGNILRGDQDGRLYYYLGS